MPKIWQNYSTLEAFTLVLECFRGKIAFEMTKKNFDVVGAKENCVLILDDTETVWWKQKENLMDSELNSGWHLMMLFVYAGGVVLTTLITVPNWPFFNGNLLKWLDPSEAEKHPKPQSASSTSKKKAMKT
ncbi:hypothetical protein RJ639_041388 [Escallonia herrerae]|uniref:Signal peptidase complex subunit 1 n=1 Tax=Escallonia herrerae TaxID=1293975 RepID=A0AA88WIA6_9ASTE|nr:hypothetical protein RJ639_041388 [Escallonia herrerae]